MYSMKSKATVTAGKQFRRVDSRFVRLVPANEFSDSEAMSCRLSLFKSDNGFYKVSTDGSVGYDVSTLKPS